MVVAEQRARALLREQSLERLLEQWELSGAVNDKNIYMVRGWLMDEIQRRNPEGFSQWLDSDECEDSELRAYVMI